MKYIIGIDDTDNLESFSTGIVLEQLSKFLSTKIDCTCTPVVRHQLLFDPRIKYTSHNSSMSIELKSCVDIYTTLIEICSTYLQLNHAIGSDPGLCILKIDNLIHKEKLLNYGFKTKVDYIEIHEALALSKECNIHLSSHGGTGEGVIGALAAVALRLSGKDGKARGTLNLSINSEEMSVATLISSNEIDLICDINGITLNNSESIHIKDRIKTIYRDGKFILLVKKILIDSKEYWTNYSIKEIKDLNL